MILAALQMTAVVGSIQMNLATIEATIGEAALAGADLVVFPELALTGYGAGDAIRRLAEPADGPSLRRIASLARSHRIAVALGFAEANGTELYNSAAFVPPDEGPVIYRKRHLFGPYEKDLFAPSRGTCRPFTFRDARLAMCICYDVEFPEVVREVAEAGAEILLTPTALPAGPASDFIAQKMIPTRAFENNMTIVYADHAGSDDCFTYAGQSVIVLADGTEPARAGREGSMLLVSNAGASERRNAIAEIDYLHDLHERGRR